MWNRILGRKEKRKKVKEELIAVVGRRRQEIQ